MKLRFILLFCVLFQNCSNVTELHSERNQKSSIVFVFPESVSNLLANEIEKKRKNIYLCLYTINNYYQLVICEYSPQKNDTYANKSNRTVFLKGKFYALVTDSDMLFGTTSSESEILKTYLTDKDFIVKRSYSIHEGYFINFQKDGKILKEGHGNKVKNE